MSEELTELQEHAEHAKDDPKLAPVSVTMAILAVLVAVVTLLGHRAHTEEVVKQAKIADQWAFYQSKNLRRHLDLFFNDLTSVQPTSDKEALAELRDQYSKEATSYKGDQKKIEDEANKLEAEFDVAHSQADRFDLAEVFLEVGLVITSITMLSGRRLYWFLGITLAVVGIGIAVTGFFIH